jgi:hypothetical protein
LESSLDFVSKMRFHPLWPGLACCLALPLAAQTPPGSSTPAPRMVARAARAEIPPVIDGRPDDPVWQTAPLIDGFIQHEPFDGRPATERTEVRILYDKDAVYVGAWLYDSDPSGIVRGEARRDVNLDELDAFQIVFDTYRDRQNAFVFGTTPAGVEYDGQVTKEGDTGFGATPKTDRRAQAGSGGGLNLNWDGDWSVKTSMDAHGWYAEFRIPFSTLRYDRGGPQVWGANFARNIRRKNEQVFWTPIPRQYLLYRVSLAGVLEGIEAPARRVATVTPYVLGNVHRDYALPDASTKLEVGGDAKFGLTQSLTLDLTYNTDFAQVEVDDQQVNLTRFSLFFPEKRPFFLENAGSFAVGTPETVELFFSRRIGIGLDREEVPLLGGARVTGKVGGFSVGALDIQAQSRDSISPNNYGVVRMFKELPNRSRVGGVFISRFNTDDGGDYNLTYGIDGQWGVGQSLLFEGYAAQTQTPGRDGADYAWNLSGNYKDRDWEFGLAYRAVQEDFNPEVGFVSYGNTQFLSYTALRHLRTPNVSWFREFRPHVTVRQYMDFDGFITNRLIHVDNHFQFANGAFFQLPALNFTRDGLRDPFEIRPGIVIPVGTYDNFFFGFSYNTNLSSPLSVSGRIELGGFYSGTKQSNQVTVVGRFGDFLGELKSSFDHVTLPEGNFDASLVSAKLAYSFTPHIYVQSQVQYNNETENVSANVRFGWLNAAGTGLFLVYNGLEYTGLEPGPVDRAFTIKFTRLFGL